MHLKTALMRNNIASISLFPKTDTDAEGTRTLDEFLTSGNFRSLKTLGVSEQCIDLFPRMERLGKVKR